MKLLAALGTLLAIALGLRYVSNRIATHQTILPSLVKRVNTQVHRINQS
ncbi:MAG: hypothetical protein HZY75_01480 [Nocardioidaceae bacterium]|nr:MAG: hypothetical protein HZY75_01480 [Nocardioidaceae bacterium]